MSGPAHHAITNIDCPDCGHPWGYHHWHRNERGCDMPLGEDGQPDFKQTVRRCMCKRCGTCEHRAEGCTCGLTFRERMRGVNVDKSSLLVHHQQINEERRREGR